MSTAAPIVLLDWKKLTSEQHRFMTGMLRVNHAGEYGAVHIYKGQIAVLGRSPHGPLLRVNYVRMADVDTRKGHVGARTGAF